MAQHRPSRFPQPLHPVGAEMEMSAWARCCKTPPADPGTRKSHRCCGISKEKAPRLRLAVIGTMALAKDGKGTATADFRAKGASPKSAGKGGDGFEPALASQQCRLHRYAVTTADLCPALPASLHIQLHAPCKLPPQPWAARSAIRCRCALAPGSKTACMSRHARFAPPFYEHVWGQLIASPCATHLVVFVCLWTLRCSLLVARSAFINHRLKKKNVRDDRRAHHERGDAVRVVSVLRDAPRAS